MRASANQGLAMKKTGITFTLLLLAFAGTALADATEDFLSLIHISEPTRPAPLSRMPSSA